jgi:hypothetical protein
MCTGNCHMTGAVVFCTWRLYHGGFFFFYSVDCASLYNLVNETNLVHNILSIVYQCYLKPLRVLDLSRSIIRRNNCIYVTLGTCYSVWYAGWHESHAILHTRQLAVQNDRYQVSHKYSCPS